MSLKEILDLPERKPGKRKNSKGSYWLVFSAFVLIGISYLIDFQNEAIYLSVVALSGVLFALYLIINFISWDNKKPNHYVLFIGNLLLTAGLILKIIQFNEANTIILISVGLIFLSFALSYVIGSGN